jgi:hypothetical protein
VRKCGAICAALLQLRLFNSHPCHSSLEKHRGEVNIQQLGRTGTGSDGSPCAGAALSAVEVAQPGAQALKPLVFSLDAGGVSLIEHLGPGEQDIFFQHFSFTCVSATCSVTEPLASENPLPASIGKR